MYLVHRIGRERQGSGLRQGQEVTGECVGPGAGGGKGVCGRQQERGHAGRVREADRLFRAPPRSAGTLVSLVSHYMTTTTNGRHYPDRLATFC